MAVVLSAASGVIVLDVDARNGGVDSLARLEAANSHLPVTIADENERDGGGHYFMRFAGSLPAETVKLADGVALMGPGAMVVMPPSQHRLGGRRAWQDARTPTDVKLAQAPEWIEEAARRAVRPKPRHGVLGEAADYDAKAILEALRDGCRGCVANPYSGHCPVPEHADQHPSVDVVVRHGKTLWTCRAGCDQERLTLEIQRIPGARQSREGVVRGLFPKQEPEDPIDRQRPPELDRERFAAFLDLVEKQYPDALPLTRARDFSGSWAEAVRACRQRAFTSYCAGGGGHRFAPTDHQGRLARLRCGLRVCPVCSPARFLADAREADQGLPGEVAVFRLVARAASSGLGDTGLSSRITRRWAKYRDRHDITAGNGARSLHYDPEGRWLMHLILAVPMDQAHLVESDGAFRVEVIEERAQLEEWHAIQIREWEFGLASAMASPEAFVAFLAATNRMGSRFQHFGEWRSQGTANEEEQGLGEPEDARSESLREAGEQLEAVSETTAEQ